MIAHLRGKLLAKRPNQAIVETGGVGYDVTISVPTYSGLPAAGGEVALHIHTHVREDTIALYGFLRPAEKTVFEEVLATFTRMASARVLFVPPRTPRDWIFTVSATPIWQAAMHRSCPREFTRMDLNT